MALNFVERSEKLSAKTACGVNVGQVKKKREIQNSVFESIWRRNYGWLCAHNWKEQAICLQKLQAVVITFLLFNFLEEYIKVKRT